MSLLWVKAMYGEEDDPDHQPMAAPSGNERPNTFRDRTPDCGEHTDDQKRAIASTIAKERNHGYDYHPEGECPTARTFEGETFCPGHSNPNKGYQCSECTAKAHPGARYSWDVPDDQQVHHVLKPEDIHVMDRNECEQTHLSAGEHARNAEQGHKHVSINYGAAHHPPGTPGHGWGAVYGFRKNGEGLECWMD
jgi:hypothetical protein